ncbi:MAG: hypothetical protein U5K51_16455 [Flavobacteriaceae bacterium]|nr:hypothetical protein [Flavobacteriaceae bacterium]
MDHTQDVMNKNMINYTIPDKFKLSEDNVLLKNWLENGSAKMRSS